MRIRQLLLAMVLAAVTRDPGAAACEAERSTAVPITTERGLWTVVAAVDEKPSRFVLDTGAERTTLSIEAVRRLGLARDEWVSSMIRGVGGVEWQANAVMRSFEMGGVELRRRSVNPALSFAVAPMPFLDRASDPIAGLLGADYLSVFDLEIDPAGRTLMLHAMGACRDGAVPWTVRHVSVRARRPRPTVLLVPVQIDGVVLDAQLDTGASVSLLTRRGAARLKLPSDAVEAAVDEQAQGVGRQPLALRRHRVSELRFGPIVARDIDIAVGAPAGGSPFDMLLGLDVLRDARMWLSYATDRVLIATP